MKAIDQFLSLPSRDTCERLIQQQRVSSRGQFPRNVTIRLIHECVWTGMLLCLHTNGISVDRQSFIHQN